MDEALTDGVDVGQLLDQLLGYFRDVMAAAVGCPPDTFLHTSPSDREGVVAAERLGLTTVLAIMQILDQTLSRLRYSTHGRTLAELALVRIAHLEDLDNLARVGWRIANRGLRSPGGNDSAHFAPANRKKKS